MEKKKIPEPEEFIYIEDFFKSLGPQAIPITGTNMYKLLLKNENWSNIIGFLSDNNLDVLRIRAKYMIFKYLDNRHYIKYCVSCGKIINCTIIDNRLPAPWENTCNACFTSTNK